MAPITDQFVLGTTKTLRFAAVDTEMYRVLGKILGHKLCFNHFLKKL